MVNRVLTKIYDSHSSEEEILSTASLHL